MNRGTDRALGIHSVSPSGALPHSRPPPRHRARCASGSSSIVASARSQAATPLSAAPHPGRDPRWERMGSPGPPKGYNSRRILQALPELRNHTSDILTASATPTELSVPLFTDLPLPTLSALEKGDLVRPIPQEELEEALRDVNSVRHQDRMIS
ncbi:hypothetical protein NDU88_006227 [Pleurodeles waltl]|uniref:Uncharacterized protein n=1 Tax=Pleurodeles waltl TaxID=8319 RepID=A0AAV7QLC1_PLEWA|nr:hypothetical protein NDU88_006227 [Pleurodeles waltl]